MYKIFLKTTKNTKMINVEWFKIILQLQKNRVYTHKCNHKIGYNPKVTKNGELVELNCKLWSLDI